jgi:hypothetical protein
MSNEGLPYFVMDYVDRQPIDAWCDRHTLKVTERSSTQLISRAASLGAVGTSGALFENIQL